MPLRLYERTKLCRKNKNANKRKQKENECSQLQFCGTAVGKRVDSEKFKPSGDATKSKYEHNEGDSFLDLN